ncbi:MAG: hypothetical protein KME38_25455 [Spirirestis rafaelensis WJT71-NPBG6]|nr:hypothetical protein [Spirirestis rafaelensis WJT71-NPBG6]
MLVPLAFGFCEGVHGSQKVKGKRLISQAFTLFGNSSFISTPYILVLDDIQERSLFFEL